MAMKSKHWWISGVVLVLAAILVALIVNRTFVSRSTAASSASDSTPASVPSTAGPAHNPSTDNPSTAAAPPSSPTPAPTSNVSTSPAGAVAAKKLSVMSLEQRVGQILMVSSPVTGADENSLYALDSLFVGNVFMKGRSAAGVGEIAAQVQEVTQHVSGAGTQGVKPFIATDQEGGAVQIMRGPGFSDMPAAIEQGQQDPATLEADATQWGKQLASAGVNVNLAPVLDTVPSAGFAVQNAPIGAFGREYGYSPETVSAHGLAFARGMMAAGVDPTVKHFPGLGRVTLNTDVSAGVRDDITVRNDPFIAPFRDAVNADVPWLMVSNAYYPKIDSAQLAPFSNVIVHDMVRGDLGFKGIIVSDDICDAVQVAAVPVAERGVDFIAAGGTMALCTNQGLAPQMYQGMVAKAQADPSFAQKVDAAALRVLEAKAVKGLIS